MAPVDVLINRIGNIDGFDLEEDQECNPNVAPRYEMEVNGRVDTTLDMDRVETFINERRL